MYAIESPSVSHGTRSYFFRLKRNNGFKTFRSKEEADYAHSVQTALAKHDLAPYVRSEVGRVRTGNRLSDWGFVTEIARTVKLRSHEEDNGSLEVPERLHDRLYSLDCGIDRAGYHFIDAHVGNVGYVRRRGRSVLVCIDTGEESVTIKEYW